MSSIRLSSRYAKSILDLSIEKGELEKVLADFKNIIESIKENRDLALLLKSPIINSERKQLILEKIYKGKVENMTMTFLDIVVRKGRAPYLLNMAEAFITQYNLYKGITKVKITTAVATDDAMVNAILSQVKTKTNIDKVELETAVNENLIGGFTLQYDDKLFDASISRQLELLEKEFSNNAFVGGF
jgi:F-type H+-transporting ATPase subunit delta